MNDIFFNQSNWQKELSNAISDVASLYELLELPLPSEFHAPAKFPLRVPHAFIQKMKKGDPSDPLLRQILPDIAESLPVAGYTADPLDENTHNPIKGLLHKYQSRALITVTGACAVHCRYCFRQHFDYGANLPNSQDIRQICYYIANDKNINEVLLSGGDPLNINNRRFNEWIRALSDIDNIKTIRIHTRLPAILPNRIDDEFIDILAHCPKNIVMVLHINHANEIDNALAQKCQTLKKHGVVLLNQSVLLKGVNDNVEILCQLSHALFDIGVLPYYLHILDKVAGSAHFDLPTDRAIQIYWQLLEKLSGYLVPKLVQEVAGKPYKVPIDIYKNC
ncbi:EF-P beta-lysylation protein EpmB [Moraxella bovis]|uniref:EF-P beta-lysylation protein EpmB n=1 Tax=Moraxella bovis TaxID=476 RepID=UPI002226B63E|nr:EF-P beta-lysylation protein EpmB [Moraxella bovis]UYZ68987.1 EF-P beta-lysylation protein EpmB [Moraxella bovis]UYZ71361.1 EF-P beta-lysylation protein EpmB [Moraxella bovis]UYZ72726.1 EF-P beta-lysylation protein EpmB [Moraxella bovis]UZA14654.1 EF-P beta-lysylation protein EpmB [Moraxella bovis]UZA26983.1 EF-P beta-lysylation protein EpmB [Moraxella bovis]